MFYRTFHFYCFVFCNPEPFMRWNQILVHSTTCSDNKTLILFCWLYCVGVRISCAIGPFVCCLYKLKKSPWDTRAVCADVDRRWSGETALSVHKRHSWPFPSGAFCEFFHQMGPPALKHMTRCSWSICFACNALLCSPGLFLHRSVTPCLVLKSAPGDKWLKSSLSSHSQCHTIIVPMCHCGNPFLTSPWKN